MRMVLDPHFQDWGGKLFTSARSCISEPLWLYVSLIRIRSCCWRDEKRKKKWHTEIKSPESFNSNTFEHKLKDATKQSPNLIIDTSRIKKVRDLKVRNFLVNQMRKQKQIKRMIMVTKRGQIIDISALIWYNKDIEVLAGRSMCRARELLFYAIIILKVRQAVMDMHRFGAFFFILVRLLSP